MSTASAVTPIRFRIGKRIYLRPILKEDIPFITVWINDPEVNQFLKVHVPMTPEDEMRWFEELSTRKPGNVTFAIVLKENDEFIGVMGLHHVDYRNGVATTGSFIGKKEYWSQGYGTEAKILVLEYAFNTLNLRKICSVVYDYNPRSKRCLEKCGYRVEGIRKQHAYHNGVYRSHYIMAVFKGEFRQIWNKYKKAFLDNK